MAVALASAPLNNTRAKNPLVGIKRHAPRLMALHGKVASSIASTTAHITTLSVHCGRPSKLTKLRTTKVSSAPDCSEPLREVQSRSGGYGVGGGPRSAEAVHGVAALARAEAEAQGDAALPPHALLRAGQLALPLLLAPWLADVAPLSALADSGSGMAPLPEMVGAFNLATFGPQYLWLLMIIWPRAAVTRAVMAPLWAVAAAAAVHVYVDAVGFQQPEALEELAKFGGVFDQIAVVTGRPEVPIDTFRNMLQNPNFVTEEWAHVLAWDLFVGRWIWLDGLNRGIDTRLALLTTNFTGPPGLFLHLFNCLLSGKGLPPSGLRAAAPPAAPPVEAAAGAGSEARADAVLQRVWGAAGGEAGARVPRGVPERFAAACSEDVVWEDMGAAEAARGRLAVWEMLSAREEADAAAGAWVEVERAADGRGAAGFTWHRAAEGSPRTGLRGTTFVSLDPATGLIDYVREGSEPLFKPGGSTAALLKAIAKPPEDEAAPPAPLQVLEASTSASEIVRYLWEEVQQQGGAAMTEESLRFFAEDVLYEDFNFKDPFRGKAQVAEFLEEFNIPGLKFIPQRISDGERACCFTWEVDLGTEGAPRVQGLSFYEVDAGRIAFVRDIPAPAIKPPPLQSVAAVLDPALRVFPSA